MECSHEFGMPEVCLHNRPQIHASQLKLNIFFKTRVFLSNRAMSNTYNI